MKNNKQLDNTLIKTNKMREILAEAGIKRVDPSAYIELNNIIKNQIVLTAKQLKEEITINGRRTLKKQDIINLTKEEKNGN